MSTPTIETLDESTRKVHQEAREQRAFADARVDENGIPSARITTEDLMGYNNSLLGRVLTILEVAITNEKQFKAAKSLMNGAFWNNYGMVREWMSQNANGYPQAYHRFPFHQHATPDTSE
jgi:hypothetical protein